MRPFQGSATAAGRWSEDWGRVSADPELVLLLAATDTASVEGISAAGATPASRRQTAAADAELLWFGPGRPLPHALPPLPAGVTPALISQVVVATLALSPLVVDLGCPVAPGCPHLRLPGLAGAGAARCLSSGRAMAPERVLALLEQGRRWGETLGRRQPGRPLLLAECVPGGTSTAQALLTGLGVEVEGLMSGSLLHPAHGLKATLVAQGLAAAGLEPGAAHEPLAVLAAVGDPMQPLAAGLVLAAAAASQPVLLAGGGQMAAVLALALALAPPWQRSAIVRHVAVGTTAWVAGECHSNLALVLERIGHHWQVQPLGLAADLRFHGPIHPALAAYERGFVKEGVGAGGLALLWQLTGRSPEALARACDRACRQLLESNLGADPPRRPGN